jgi:hypothetical protein
MPEQTVPNWLRRKQRRARRPYRWSPEEDAQLQRLYGQAARPGVARRLTETLRRLTGDEAAQRSISAAFARAVQLGLEVRPADDEASLIWLARVSGVSNGVLCEAAWSGALPSTRRAGRRWVKAGDWEVWLARYRARQGDGTAICTGGHPWAGRKPQLPPGRDGDYTPFPGDWTPAEEQFLVDHLGILSDEEIAQALGRSPAAVPRRRSKRGLPAPSKHPEYITPKRIAKALGINEHLPIRWVKSGLLPGRRLPLDGVVHVVRRVTFLRWFVNPHNWIYFGLGERIRDPHLRRLFELKQARWQDAWWTLGQVAAYHGVERYDVAHAVEDGRIAAVKWGKRWVLKSEATRPGLALCRGKRHDFSRNWPEELDAFVVLARAVGLSYLAIARLARLSRGGLVAWRLRSLHRRGRIPALVESHGLRVLYDAESGRLLADWKAYRGRFPALTRALARFERGKPLTKDEAAMVAGVLAAWGEWQAETDEQRAAAGGQRRAANLGPAALRGAYERLRQWGIDPLHRTLPG